MRNGTSTLCKRTLEIVCLIALFANAALAAGAYAAWDGVTKAPPAWNVNHYDISTEAQLAEMASWINEGRSADQSYRLVADMDLGNNEWTPIGHGALNDSGILVSSDSRPFRGSFDGNGKTIYGLKITKGECIGLFGAIGLDGSVRDLRIDDAIVMGENSAGMLAGYNDRGIITLCSVNGRVDGGINTGGLVGVNAGAVTSSVSSGPINGKYNVGGLTGLNYADDGNTATVAFSASYCDVTAASTAAGGLVGYNYAKIASSAAFGKATGDGSVGGLVGYNIAGVRASYAMGAVSGANKIGGLVGWNNGEEQTLATVSMCYACGGATAQSGAKGGLIGENGGGSGMANVRNSDWRSPADAKNATGIGADKARQKTAQKLHAAQMNDMSKGQMDWFVHDQGWDFKDTWCYTPLDDEARPNLQDMFIDGGAKTLNPRMVSLCPGSVTMGPGEKRTIALNALGFTPANYRIVGHPADVSITGDGATITIATPQRTDASVSIISVAYNINGIPQAEQSFRLIVNAGDKALSF